MTRLLALVVATAAFAIVAYPILTQAARIVA
jgi:hypothetical protein